MKRNDEGKGGKEDGKMKMRIMKKEGKSTNTAEACRRKRKGNNKRTTNKKGKGKKRGKEKQRK